VTPTSPHTPDEQDAPGALDENERERRRRLVEAYRAGVPSDAEISRAERRMGTQGSASRRSLTRVWGLGLSQGFVAGLVTLAAASFVGAKVLPRLSFFRTTHELEAHPPESERTPAARRPTAHPPPMPAAPADTAPTSTGFDAIPESPPPRDPAEAPENAEASPRGVVVPRPAAPHAAVAAKESSSDLPATEASDVLPSTEGPWARVAQALALRDFDRADEALRALQSSSDVITRDAASLSRAEIWIARGSGSSVAATVQRLARSGSTPFIRRRATELLTRLRHTP
jgi:hypothetical protein